MKKFFILLFAILFQLSLYADNEQSAVFEFRYPTTLNPSIANPTESIYVGIVSKEFTSNGITVSFPNFGPQSAGVRLTYVQDLSSAYLQIFTGWGIKFVASPGRIINKITFSNDSEMAGLSTVSGTPGTLSDDRLVWSNTGSDNVTEVAYSSNSSSTVIYKVTVDFTVSDVSLSPSSISPASGSTLSSFENMTLTFDSDMSVLSQDGLKVVNTDDNTEIALTATASGNNIVLTPATSLSTNGSYNVVIPASSFQNASGYKNVALSYSFTLATPKTTLTYESVDPEQGSVDKLQSGFSVTFNKDIAVTEANKKNLVILKSGEEDPVRQVEYARDATDSKKLVFTFNGANTSNITEYGTYSITIPENTVNNGYTDEKYLKWNPEFTLTWTVGTPPPAPKEDTETMKLAKQLVKYSEDAKVGYPTTDTESYKYLKVLTTQEETPSDETIQAGIDNLYKETVVTLPVTGKYYNIIAVNNGDKKFYLAYANDTVSITSNAADAAKFKATASNGKTFFEVEDKYLTILTSTDYSLANKSNVTATYNASVNNLSLAKHLIDTEDIKKQFGLMSMYGYLGKDLETEEECSAYSTINFATNKVNKPGSLAFFTSAKSTAFLLEETTAPEVITPIAVTCNVPSEVAALESTADVVFPELENVTIVAGAEPYLQYTDGTNKTPVTLTAKSGTTNAFTFGVSNLADTTYTLVLPQKTILFTKEGAKFTNTPIQKTFKKGGCKIYEDFYIGFELVDPIRDVDLNNFVFTSYKAPFKEIYADTTSTKTVELQTAFGSKISSGHLVETTYPGNPNIKAYKVQLNPEITEGEILSGDYSFLFPALTYGDEVFGEYLQGKPLSAKEMHVNTTNAISFHVDNSLAAIKDVNATSVNAIREGKFIENGKVVIIKNGKRYNFSGMQLR